MDKSTFNLWESVGNRALELARIVLDATKVPTDEQIRAARGLVDIAIAIDDLNLRWQQNHESNR